MAIARPTLSPRRPRALAAYDAVILVGAVVTVAVAASGWHGDTPRPPAGALAVLIIAPVLTRMVAHHVRGAYPVLLGVALAIAVLDRVHAAPATLTLWAAVVVLTAAASALAGGRRTREAAALAGIEILAGGGLVLAARPVDLGVRPFDQLLVGLATYLLVAWALTVPRDVLASGWSSRAAVTRRSLAVAAGGAIYVGLLIAVLLLIRNSDHNAWVGAGAAVVLLLLGVSVWQAVQILTLTRISRALTEAAVTTPWPTADIDTMLLRLVRAHVRASRVAIDPRPSDGSLWAPLAEDRYLVLERDPGDFGFTHHDASLIAGLTSMARASHEHAEREQRLEHEAVTDHLTGLWSFRHWRDLLALESARREESEPLGVVFLDFDGFKQINSRYGHLQADTILAAVGERLLLQHGSAVGWRFCRFGGDEFAGWVRHPGDAAGFDRLCEELGELIACPIRIGRHELSVTASIGRALSTHAVDEVEDLVELAELDMRRRKIGRPGAVLAHHAGPDVVRRILDAGDVAVAYQPIVELVDGRVWGWEALLRGHTSALGAIPPPALVESAADARLLDALTRQVMEQAIDTVTAAIQATGERLTMTLNIETEQFHPASPLLDWLVERVDAAGVPVVLELSERSPMAWRAEQQLLADELARHDVGVALDDLGAGQARFGLLWRRQWDLVKLDRGLLVDDPVHGEVILRHAMAMFDELGVTTSLLEGIESEQQLALARRLGIRYGQGNGFGRPISASALLDALADRGLTVAGPILPRR